MQESSGGCRHPYRYIGALLVALAMTAAGCGGNGDDEPPPPPPGPLTVGVTIDGAPGAVMTLQAARTVTIQVVSGKKLAFVSPHGSTWTITSHEGAKATIQTDTLESKAVTVNGDAGSSIDFQFANSSDSMERATVTVRLAVGEFGRVEPRNGEVQDWIEGQATSRLTVQVLPASYVVATEYPWSSLVEEYTSYDDKDARMNRSSEDHSCTDTPPYPAVVYPVDAGKSWTYEGSAECSDSFGGYHWLQQRSVSSMITGFENVTIGAGTYYAARIESEESLEVTGDIDSLNGSGTTSKVCWWATEIGRVVSCKWTRRWNGKTFVSSNEMTSFAQ